MIAEGINSVKSLHLDSEGYYNVELSRISLPHMPVSRHVLSALKLSKHELVGHFSQNGKTLPAFKVASVTAQFKDGQQILRGKIRSVGVGTNLSSYLRTQRPTELRFLLSGRLGSHDDYPGAFEIKAIDGWILPLATLSRIPVYED